MTQFQSNPDWHTPDPSTQPEFYADVPLKRLLAWVIDSVIIALISMIAVIFTAFTGLFFFPVLMLLTGFAYRTITLSRGSATWGMRIMAIEFRTWRGEHLDLPTAALHTLGYTLSVAFMMPQVISVVLMLTGPRAQGLTDHVLGTIAINRRAGS
ncbi:RDD family protein [Rhodobacteraceae bacterium KMM 6894]|nr:RDD family protein [Rhodobacteraceae bacterium KMM 6894]